jgi:formate dehydrogenase major subunit
MSLRPRLFQSLDVNRRTAQPYSRRSVDKHSRIREATAVTSVCNYCAVGCSTLIYTKRGSVIDIEGNPESPINEGTLCPKGANLFQQHHNPNRVKHALWRAPFADGWQQVPLDWALDRIAGLVKETRDENFRQFADDGSLLNHVTNMGTLGGATLDNEENYLIKKLFAGGLGVVSVENQARI